MRPADERLVVWRRFSGTARWFQSAISDFLEETSRLSLAELELLIQVRAAGGEVPMAVLAQRLGITRAGMTKMVDRLAAIGYLRRRRSSTDRRVRNLILTDRGRTTMTETRPLLERWLERNFHGRLSATDLRAIDRAMGKLIAANRFPDPADRL